MSLATAIELFPQELQLPMFNLVEAVQKDMRDQLAVRREDFEKLVEAQKRTEQRIAELAEAQKRTEQRVGRLEIALVELADAQKRTEQRVAELAEAQKRTEQRVGHLEIALVELAEAQKRTEQRVGRLEIALAELSEAQKRTEQRVEELTEAQKRTEEVIRTLIERQDRMEIKLDSLVGDQMERRYREKAFAYFGRVLRQVKVVSLQELEANLEQHLSKEEFEELLPLDLLVSGRTGRGSDAPMVWLAVEVSAVVDRNDVERAVQRAHLLNRAGYSAIPTVAGQNITRGGKQAVREHKVFLLQDGHNQFWEEALAQTFENR